VDLGNHATASKDDTNLQLQQQSSTPSTLPELAGSLPSKQ